MKAQTVDLRGSTGRILCCTVFRPGEKSCWLSLATADTAASVLTNLAQRTAAYARAALQYSKHFLTSATVSAPLYSYSIFAGRRYFLFAKSCSTGLMGVSPWPNGIFWPSFFLRS